MIYTKHGTFINVVETELNKPFWRDHYSYWENSTFDFLFRYLDKEKTFIDIGAWIGPISLIACQHSKSCLCFEPDPIAYSELVDNVDINGFTNISLDNRAVSIHKNISLGSSVMGHSETRDSCTANSISCDCISIPEILAKHQLDESNISVIKIDIEGHESELLQEKALWDLNVPIHLSLHPGWAADRELFYDKVIPFLVHKGIDVSNIREYGNFFDIVILPKPLPSEE